MAYTKGQMVYNDYYWSARSDHDNPKVIGGVDQNQLNRTEGYEMLYFINSLAKTWNWREVLSSYQNLERIIRTSVPTNIRTHSGIRDWIANNYTNI